MIDLDRPTRMCEGIYDWLENIKRMKSNTMTYGFAL